MDYCSKIYQTSRFKTKEVNVGGVKMGGSHPVRIQSMTNTPTEDVEATLNQIMQLYDHGCELVRVTVQGKKEARACQQIKNKLIQKGYEVPLIADIHFYPPAALEVVDFVDKIRINPGNFVDKRASFKKLIYESEEQYQNELIRIEEGLIPLIEKMKKGNKVLRLGVNHGSLSDRIMSRYGDTPFGMVESAFEYARLCQKHGFDDLVFSMKSSNPLVMIQAYRLLSSKMKENGWNYPLHLGVTEAGPGEDGRIKSAVGIGSLLLDGLGDTIRVSLTEDPCHEIEACREILSVYQRYRSLKNLPFSLNHFERKIPPIEPKRLKKNSILNIQVKEKNQPVSEKADGIYEQEPPYLAKGNVFHSADGESYPIFLKDDIEYDLEKLSKAKILFVHIPPFKMHLARKFYDFYCRQGLSSLIVLCISYHQSQENIKVQASMELGSLLCDSIGDAVAIDSELSYEEEATFLLNLLQACRKRQIKTEYIACPGCGRTLFPLEEVTLQIQKKTSHIPGLKIAVMGCIVNGPGEMADADFGYVGSKSGHVDLYIGKNCAEKNIPSSVATDRLIDLIKENGRWIEQQNS